MKCSNVFIFTFLFFLVVNVHAQTDSIVPKRPKIGLVLSGGGAKGFAHIGVLKVLEEVGIQPDYITGTSMGGILGGFYALGFSADSIAKVVSLQDWELLMNDKIRRSDLAFQDKENDERYVLTLPIRKKGIDLPSGIVSGQRVTSFFTEYSAGFHDSTNFKNFPIPFSCIAADIETGNYCVLEKGYLPEALRATMSIPSVFKPVTIDGRLLVDGGLVNNFPVEEVIKMGADIVIGVDVQSPYFKQDELNSILRIVEQSSKFLRAPMNEKNRALCDIYLGPGIEEYSISSFTQFDSIIASGEREARRILPQLRQLADSLKKMGYAPRKIQLPKLPDKYFVDDIQLIGLQNVTRQLVLGRLNFKIPGYYSMAQIKDAIERVFASNYFERVTFRLKENKGNKILELKVEESNINTLNVGLHYNSDFNASILINATFRNIYRNGSLTQIEARLGENSSFAASFLLDKGWKPGFFAKFSLSNIEVYEYQDLKRTASYNYSSMNYFLGFQSSFLKNASLRYGAEVLVSSISEKISPVSFEGIDFRSINYLCELNVDTYDRLYYPNSGLRIKLFGRLATRGLEDYQEFNPYSNVILKCSSVLSFGKILAIIPELYAGAGFGTMVPIVYYNYLGGRTDYQMVNSNQFTGMELMEIQKKNAAVAAMNFRLRLAPNHYFTLVTNLGAAAETYKNLADLDGWFSGVGISYGYNSLIGPVDLTLSTASTHDSPLTYVSVGFWF